MLRLFVAYSRGGGVDMRWAVIEGSPDFFQVTKRLHNFLHGSPGDGGDLGAAEAAAYDSVTGRNADQLAAVVRPQDVVILHDPQTAGLVEHLKAARNFPPLVVWRSHEGAEESERARAQSVGFSRSICAGGRCLRVLAARLRAASPWATAPSGLR